MSHVSKKDIDAGIKLKLFNQLFEAFHTAGRRNNASIIVEEFFTPTEKIMFAKRLSIIMLINKGIPQHTISEYLQVSGSTITRVAKDLDRGKYRKISNLAGSKMERILETTIKLILFSMPPRVGRGRWKNLNRFFN